MNDEPKQQAAIVNGGEDIPVSFTDGRREMVKVRLLSVRELERYAANAESPARLAGLFTRRPDEWVDALDHDSLYRIVERGEALNAGPFAEFARRQKARGELLKAAVQPAA